MFYFSFSNQSDKSKFEYFFNKYNKLLYKYSFEILKNHSDVEDALQITYLKIYNNLHKISIEEEKKSINFMITIVINTSKTLIMKNKNNDYHLDINPDLAYDSDDFDKNFDINDMKIAIFQLDNDDRNILLLKYIYGYSLKELADIFDTTEQNIGIRIFRIKKKVKNLILQRR